MSVQLAFWGFITEEIQTKQLLYEIKLRCWRVSTENLGLGQDLGPDSRYVCIWPDQDLYVVTILQGHRTRIGLNRDHDRYLSNSVK